MDALTEIVRRLIKLEDIIARMGKRDVNTSSRGVIIEVGAANELATQTTFHRVMPIADGASSDVTDIELANDGLVVTFSPYTTGKTLVFKDNTGNLRLAGDCTLDSPHDTLSLRCDRTLSVWAEVSRSNNA